jgi:hypothetical protein
MGKVAITKAASVEQFDSIDAFRKTFTMPTVEVVQNSLSLMGEGLRESLQGFQATGFHTGQPLGQTLLGGLTVRRLVEPSPEIFFQCVAQFQLGRKCLQTSPRYPVDSNQGVLQLDFILKGAL